MTTQTTQQACLKLESAALGIVSYGEQHVVNCVTPIIGFEQLSDFIVVNKGNPLLFWLQSTEETSVSFLLLDVFKAGIDIPIEIGAQDAADLEATSSDDIHVYAVLSVHDGEMTANLRAPILINDKSCKASQILLSDESLSMRHPLQIEQRVAV